MIRRRLMASSMVALGAVAASGTTARAETPAPVTWSPQAQAQAQGFWIVVSDTPPTVTTQYGVPVVWISVGEVTAPIPVQPAAPSFDNATSTYVIPAAQVGVEYYVQHEYPVGSTPTTGVLVSAGPYRIPAGSLPSLTRVEARPLVGYTLPGRATWTHNFPDPEATVLVTSDCFSGPDTTTLQGRRSDAGIGGAPALWIDEYGALRIVGGRLTTSGGVNNLASLPVQAIHQEIEFDLVASAAVPLDRLHLNVGGNGIWNSGFGINWRITADGRDDGCRIFDNGVLIGRTAVGAVVGHYKISVVHTTATVTWPDGATTTYTVSARQPDQTKISLQSWIASTPGLVFVDNISCRRIGY